MYVEAAAQPPEPKLGKAQLAYVKRGRIGLPLALAHAGPYRVIQPGLKFHVIEIGGRRESV
jgi:hypothetical protein